MLTIENTDKLINQRLTIPIGNYYVFNTWKWTQQGNEQYHLHIRHVNKTHSDIRLVLNRFVTRFPTAEGYILWDQDNDNKCMLLSYEQIKSKETFIYCIERVMQID
jgi:hypothetical protein